MSTNPPDTANYGHLIDQAKAEAARLRSEAIQHFGDEALGDFWRGANAVWQRSLLSGQGLAQRSAARLRARLLRQQKAGGSCP
ncbi:hypothetical protein [Rhodoferax sp.]|uniref:hypothetical protein n=1 Tax=Rhodoferax sp. TaxID=50421 RepID=UPI00274876BF|nr:hypothetical protein [Rhodoferax sp.]